MDDQYNEQRAERLTELSHYDVSPVEATAAILVAIGAILAFTWAMQIYLID